MGSAFVGRTGHPPVCDEELIALQTAYRPFGGIARAHQLLRLCVPTSTDMFALVQSGRAVGFAWYDVLWLPMFQFAPSGVALSGGAQQVLAAFDAASTAGVWRGGLRRTTLHCRIAGRWNASTVHLLAYYVSLGMIVGNCFRAMRACKPKSAPQDLWAY